MRYACAHAKHARMIDIIFHYIIHNSIDHNTTISSRILANTYAGYVVLSLTVHFPLISFFSFITLINYSDVKGNIFLFLGFFSDSFLLCFFTFLHTMVLKHDHIHHSQYWGTTTFTLTSTSFNRKKILRKENNTTFQLIINYPDCKQAV